MRVGTPTRRRGVRRPASHVVAVIVVALVVAGLGGCGLVFKARPFPKVRTLATTPKLPSPDPTTTLPITDVQPQDTTPVVVGPTTTTAPPPPTYNGGPSLQSVLSLPPDRSSALCSGVDTTERAAITLENIGSSPTANVAKPSASELAQLRSEVARFQSAIQPVIRSLGASGKLQGANALAGEIDAMAAQVRSSPPGTDVRAVFLQFSTQHSAELKHFSDAINAACPHNLSLVVTWDQPTP